MDFSFYKKDGVWLINGRVIRDTPTTLRFNDEANPTHVTMQAGNIRAFDNTLITDIYKNEIEQYANTTEFKVALDTFFALNEVSIKDRDSPLIIIPLAKEIASTTLSIEAVLNAKTIEVVSPASFAVGQHIRIVDDISDRFYQGTITAINTNTITLDSPLDFAYLADSQVIVATTEMSVNGSVTPVVFKHRLGVSSTPSITNISRMIVTCITDTPVTLSLKE